MHGRSGLGNSFEFGILLVVIYRTEQLDKSRICDSRKNLICIPEEGILIFRIYWDPIDQNSSIRFS